MTEKKVWAFKQWLKQPSSLITIFIALVVVGVALAVIYYYQRGEEIAATVNGEQITKEQLHEAMLAQGGREILDQLISKVLVAKEAQNRGITVSEEEIDEQLNTIIEENFAGQEESFNQAIEQYGLTIDSVREDIRIQLLMEKIASVDLEPTEEELETYFTENRQSFDIPEEVEARHILVDTREKADEILVLLNEGGDFAELAGEHSLDPGSKDQGGNLGFFTRGRMVAAFEEAAFSLSIGQISEPVETEHGFHIIEVLARKEGREVAYDEVKDDVRELMIDSLLPARINELMASLWEQADVVYR